jgi:NitT/TauT family transport system substrate-binding protein
MMNLGETLMLTQKKKRIFGALAIVGTLFAGTGQAAAQAKPLTPVRYEEVIRSIFYLPSYLALTEGYFKQEGLDVSMKTSWGSDKGTAALLSGSADIALIGPETSVYIKNGESPEKVKIFAGLTASDGSMLISRKKIDNFDWKMLKGKTVISWRVGSSPDLFLRRILKNEGIDPKEVNQVTTLAAPARRGAFVAGNGDFGTFFEPDVSEMEKAGQAFYVTSIGRAVGNIDYTVFVATDSFIKKNPAVVQAWTNAIYRAQKYAMTGDPKAIAKSVSTFFTGVELDMLASSVVRYRELGMFKTDPLTRPEAIKGLQDLLIEGGLLKESERVKYEDVVETKFAREAMTTIK